MNELERVRRAEEISLNILKLSRDRILVSLRFLDAAMAKLSFTARHGMLAVACDGSSIYYDPDVILQNYKKEPNRITRAYLHMLMHCIFRHAYHYDKVEQHLWDIASDMAAENVILELKLRDAAVAGDDERLSVLEEWKKRTGLLTAERIYKYLRSNPLCEKELTVLSRLFLKDEHFMWVQQETLELSEQEWRKISERIKADLKSFSRDKTDSEGIVENLKEATREKYDYSAFLKRFCVAGEDIQVNDDEFDYVYYTYGLSLYGNLPLVEPLEYKDVNKIKEFVIAIDTSASCRGKVVQAFLNKTYSILKNSENFFRKVNIHILQCDSKVQSDTKITCDDDFDAFMKFGHLKGFGATDFRPVFKYVEEKLEQGEFENLKGLLYFTDGYGVFPSKMPPYDTAFVFIDDDYEQPDIPPWAIKLVLSGEELEE